MAFRPLANLQPRQMEIARDIINTPVGEEKYFVLRASRQSGKTYLMERVCGYLATIKSNQVGAFILATNSQTRKVFKEMVQSGLKAYIKKTNNTDGSRYIELTNGTTIMFYSSGSYDSVAGNSFDFLVCDEFGLWSPLAWGIIKPTLAAKRNAKVVIGSTPRGRNDFYTVCQSGMDTKNGLYKHYRMSYLDNEFYDMREVEDAKATMPETVFRQEYLAEFIFGISSVFGTFSGLQKLKKYKIALDGEEYFFAIDVSGDGEDKTILTIVDVAGNPAFIHEAVNTSISKQADELWYYIKKYNASGYVETNGLGKGLFDILSDKGADVVPFIATNESKQLLVATINKSISDGEFILPTAELCPQLDNEMSTFIVDRTATGKLKYSHIKGGHDDYVDSLMMAHYFAKVTSCSVTEVRNY